MILGLFLLYNISIGDFMEDNSRILAFTCPHTPYQHRLAWQFLLNLKSMFRPTRVICLGDEADKHGASFHQSDPDLDAPGIELTKAVAALQGLEEIFPEMDIMHSNHGSMYFRKAIYAGIPRRVLKDYNEILGVGDGWKWHNELVLDLPTGPTLFKHQVGSNALNAARERNMNVVQGHYHSNLSAHTATFGDNKTLFGATAGCLIDNESMAFAYHKTQMKEPKIGAIVILDGKPIVYTLKEIMGKE